MIKREDEYWMIWKVWVEDLSDLTLIGKNRRTKKRVGWAIYTTQDEPRTRKTLRVARTRVAKVAKQYLRKTGDLSSECTLRDGHTAGECPHGATRGVHLLLASG